MIGLAFAGSVLVLVALAVLAVRIGRRRAADERLAAIARHGERRDLFPHVYVGPDTAYGLRCDTPCRVRSHKTGNVVVVSTPDGRGWNVPDRHVRRRLRSGGAA